MAYYKGDPRWMTAKYPGVDRDGNQVRAGDRIFYYPKGRVVLTGAAAEQASRDFDAAAADEDFMSRGLDGGGY